MTPEEAITAVIAHVGAVGAIGASGADDRGPETAGGSRRLSRQGDLYVMEDATWHEYNGTRDRESVTLRTRTERGLRALLRSERGLLEGLLADWRGSGAPRLTPPPPREEAAREAALDASCAAAWQRLLSGEWWLGNGNASGLVEGRGLVVAHDDRLRWLSSHDPATLRARVKAALRPERSLPFGALPPAVAADLRRWLDPAEMAREVERDAVVVNTFDPAWCSHDETSPQSSQDLVLWSVHRVSPARLLRPSAGAELSAALRGARAWIARRHERGAPGPYDPGAAALVEQAFSLAADRPLTGASVAPDGTRQECELRRVQDSMWMRIRRVAPEDGEPGEVDEHRSIDGETETRSALHRQLEWLAPAVAQRGAR